jgi:ubiquinone/menaquinone biosynthesis C-methylase UbiE
MATIKKKAAPTKPVSPQRIMQMAWDFSHPLIVEAAIRNRVFDVLDRGPKTLEQIAKATGASQRGLRALLNALVGIEYLTCENKRYALTPDVAAFLVSTKPTFMGGLLRHCSTRLIPSWRPLADIVKTGKPSERLSDEQSGSKFFALFVEDIFNMSFGPASIAAKELLAKTSGPVRVLDIATGSGVWGIAMAKASPKVQVTAVDWSDVIPVTRRVVAKHKLAKQFSYIEGDIQSADLGQNHDIATLGHILHSEGEARSRKLLKRVFAALKSGGTIVIAEFLPNRDRTGPAIPLIFAVNMLVNTELGDAFTFEEIKTWLQEVGFKKVRSLEGHGPSPLILADKP